MIEGEIKKQKENVQKISGLQTQAQIKGFRFDLCGMPNDVLYTPDVNRAIEDLESLFNEFDGIHKEYQKKIDDLRNHIFKID